MVGTHTHVQTADETILPQGTGYITDLGMTGPTNSVIGMDKAAVLERFVTQLPQKYEVAKGDLQVQGVHDHHRCEDEALPAHRKDKGKGGLRMDIEKEMEIIERGAVDLISVDELKKKLA